MSSIEQCDSAQRIKCSRCNEHLSPTSFYKSQHRCKRCSSIVNKEWRTSNPSQFRKSRASWKHRNKKRISYKNKEWKKNNPEKIKKYAAVSREKFPNKAAAHSRKYQKSHPEIMRAIDAKRRASKKKAIPKWANLPAIRKVYLKAKEYGLEVDHVVPLQSTIVCGLHVWGNLQLLSTIENQRKGNRWWPDMP